MKRLLHLGLLLWCFSLWVVVCQATDWNVVAAPAWQAVTNDSAGHYHFTITSTGAGNTLPFFVSIASSTNSVVTGVWIDSGHTDTGCNVSWSISSKADGSFSDSAVVCTDSKSGSTAIYFATAKPSLVASHDAVVAEFSKTNAGSATVETNVGNAAVTQTNPPGVTLTVTGTDLNLQFVDDFSTVPTAINGNYSANFSSGCGACGFSYALDQNSGTAPTWTGTSHLWSALGISVKEPAATNVPLKRVVQ